MAFDIIAARNDGISDVEIAQYLASKTGFNLDAAVDDGVPVSEILGHLLSKTDAGTSRQKPTADFAREGRIPQKGIVADTLYPAGLQDVTTQDIQNQSAAPRRPEPTRTVQAEMIDTDLAAALDRQKGEKLQKATAGYMAEAPQVTKPEQFKNIHDRLYPQEEVPIGDAYSIPKSFSRFAGSMAKGAASAAAGITTSIDAVGNIVKTIVGAPLTRPDEGITGYLNQSAELNNEFVTGRDAQGKNVPSPVALTPEYREQHPNLSLLSDTIDSTGGFAGQMAMSGGSALMFGSLAAAEKVAESQRKYLAQNPNATPLEAFNAAAPAALAKGYMFYKMGDVTSGAKIFDTSPTNIFTKNEAMGKLAGNLGLKTAADTGYMLESSKLEGAIDKGTGVNPNYNPSEADTPQAILPTMAQAFLFSLAHTAGAFKSATKLADANDYTTLLNAYTAARGSKTGTPEYDADAENLSGMLKQTGGLEKEVVQAAVAKLRKATADNVINAPEEIESKQTIPLLPGIATEPQTPRTQPVVSPEPVLRPVDPIVEAATRPDVAQEINQAQVSVDAPVDPRIAQLERLQERLQERFKVEVVNTHIGDDAVGLDDTLKIFAAATTEDPSPVKEAKSDISSLIGDIRNQRGASTMPANAGIMPSQNITQVPALPPVEESGLQAAPQDGSMSAPSAADVKAVTIQAADPPKAFTLPEDSASSSPMAQKAAALRTDPAKILDTLEKSWPTQMQRFDAIERDGGFSESSEYWKRRPTKEAAVNYITEQKAKGASGTVQDYLTELSGMDVKQYQKYDTIPERSTTDGMQQMREEASPTQEVSQLRSKNEVNKQAEIHSLIKKLIPRYNMFGFAGPDNANARQAILSHITGEKVPKAKAGMTAVNKAAFEVAGVKNESEFREWLNRPAPTIQQKEADNGEARRTKETVTPITEQTEVQQATNKSLKAEDYVTFQHFGKTVWGQIEQVEPDSPYIRVRVLTDESKRLSRGGVVSQKPETLTLVENPAENMPFGDRPPSAPVASSPMAEKAKNLGKTVPVQDARVADRYKNIGGLAFQEGKQRQVPSDVMNAGYADSWYKGWDRANAAAPVPGLPEYNEKMSVGKNAAGEQLFEDQNGVRYKFSDNGVKVQETVAMRPTRAGVEKTPVGRQNNPEEWGIAEETKKSIINQEESANGNNPQQAEDVQNDRTVIEGQSAEAVSPTEAVGETPAVPGGQAGSNGGVVSGGSKRPGRQSPAEAQGATGKGTSSDDEQTSGSGRHPRDVARVQRRDYRIPDGGLKREGSWKATAERNLDIIALVRQLNAEGKQATPEQQELLSKYTGFGASEIANKLFPGYSQFGEIRKNNYKDADWHPLIDKLLALELTPEELKTLAKSTQYAHYTSEGIVRGIYNALEKMGFKGGKILEPGMGSGNFKGAMPDSIFETSSYTGIEMDYLTASIAKQLYPDSNVLRADYTKQKLPKNFFDLAIGNPPFADIKILTDPEYRKNKFSLHDYFFAKTLDRLRPGGLMAFVTSRYTMDKVDDKARAYLQDRADLIGAVRLPQTAFQQQSGTEVVTDVLFFRKRELGAEPAGEAWGSLGKVTTKEGDASINEYYVNHPEMVLGTNSLQGSMYGPNEYTVLPLEGNIDDHFYKALQDLPQNIYSEATNPAEAQRAAVAERDFNPKIKKEGGLYLNDNGVIMIVENGSGVQLETGQKLSTNDKLWLADYIPLRDAVKQAKFDQWQDAGWEKSLAEVNRLYKAFVAKHGRLLDFKTYDKKEIDDDGIETTTSRRKYKNDRLFDMDTEGVIVSSLESVNDEGVIKEADFFKGRTIRKPEPPQVKTLSDALAVSLDEIGEFDLNHIAKIAKMPRKEVIEGLGDLVYETPDGKYLMSDEYLSGNVVKKLEEAEHAARADDRFKRNVKALSEVQPKPLTSRDVSVKLGATWIDTGVIEEFASEVLETPLTIGYNPATGKWKVGNSAPETRQGWYYGRRGAPKAARAQGLRNAGGEWSTSDRGPNELMDAILNNQSIKITRTDQDKKTFTDVEATAAANEKANNIRKRFSSWIWEDAERANILLDEYNKRYNNIAPRRFDGSHLTLPGVSLKYKLHPHQLRAIWRNIQTGNTYLAHAVGAGKTIEMIAAGMEMKRLGMIAKPLYVVPNHMLEQFSGEFQDLYPLASIMVADEANFSTENRKKFVAQASMNNPDAVIITHNTFKNILGMKPENVAKVRDTMMNELREYLTELQEQEGEKAPKTKQMEKRIEKAEQRFDSIVYGRNGEQLLPFEDLGVDYVFVDEAHEFRKLDFTTSRVVKGVDPVGSRASLKLYIATRWLLSRNPGRAMTFASGTPITNTIGELFTVQRFFQQEQLEEDGINHFDAWSAMFGEVEPGFEMNAAGRYEVVERFSKFDNMPELSRRVRTFMDVLTSDQLSAYVVRPEISGGQAEILVAPASEELKEYQTGVLLPRIETSKKWKPSKDEPNNPDPIIAIIADGRLASIDMRFVNNTLPSNPDSKLNQMIDNIITTHKKIANNVYNDKETGKESPVKGGSQIVFYNQGFGESVTKNRGFDAKAWVMKRFQKAGIPVSQVAWIDDYKTAEAKEAMMQEVRKGTKRILIGSAKKMGTGMNVQTRLAALHYLDPPWYPADVIQPDGRILRQGNQNKVVDLSRYATKGSYDATQWQMVARKAKAIESFLDGDSAVRSIEDLSESNQFAMAAALASGDERMLQVAGLQSDIERLNTLANAHASEQSNLRYKKTQTESGIKWTKGRIAEMKIASTKVGDYVRDFKGKIGNRTFDKRDEFGQALLDEYTKLADGWLDNQPEENGSVKVGSLNGFSIDVSHKGLKTRSAGETKFTYLISQASFVLTITDRVNGDVATTPHRSLEFAESPRGLTDKIINSLNGVSKELKERQQQLVEEQESLAVIDRRLGAPYQHSRELSEKVAELARLQNELLAEGEQIEPDRGSLPSEAVSDGFELIPQKHGVLDPHDWLTRLMIKYGEPGRVQEIKESDGSIHYKVMDAANPEDSEAIISEAERRGFIVEDYVDNYTLMYYDPAMPQPEIDQIRFSRNRATVSQNRPKYNATPEHIAAIEALNNKLAEDHGEEWRNAYEPAEIPDKGIAEAFRRTFGVGLVVYMPSSPSFDMAGGMYYKGNLYINATGGEYGFVQLAGHELFHHIKRTQPGFYTYFADQARAFIISRDLYRERLEATYLPDEPRPTDDLITEEILADFTGDALADPEFLKQMANENPSKFKAFLKAVLDWLKKIAFRMKAKGFGSSEYVKDVDALRVDLAAVLSAFSETNSPKSIDKVMGSRDVRYSRPDSRFNGLTKDKHTTTDDSGMEFEYFRYAANKNGKVVEVTYTDAYDFGLESRSLQELKTMISRYGIGSDTDVDIRYSRKPTQSEYKDMTDYIAKAEAAYTRGDFEEFNRLMDKADALEAKLDAENEPEAPYSNSTPDQTKEARDSNKPEDKETPSTVSTNFVSRAAKSFIDNDVKNIFANSGKGFVETMQLFKHAISPTSGVNSKYLDAIMKMKGNQDKQEYMFEVTGKEIKNLFDKMPREKQIDFIDRVKRGQQQTSNNLNEIASVIRDIDTAAWNEAKEFKPSLAWKENHYRVLWKEVPGENSAGDSVKRFFGGRRPLEGSKGFTKQATLDDMTQGLEMGGVPHSYNPWTMFEMAQSDIRKFITAQKMWAELKDMGAVKFIRRGQDVPENFTRLNDRLAKVYFPIEHYGKWIESEQIKELRNDISETITSSKSGNNIPTDKVETRVIEALEARGWSKGEASQILSRVKAAPSDESITTTIEKTVERIIAVEKTKEFKPGKGFVELGEWYVEEGAGRILNNHLSRDYIREASLGRGLLWVKNVTTAMELSLSAFHFTFETLEVASSQIGQGMRKIYNIGILQRNMRMINEGLKDIALSPISPITTARLGGSAIKYMANKEEFLETSRGKDFVKAHPEISSMLDMLFHGGGKLAMNQEYKIKSLTTFKEAIKEDNYIGAALRAVPAFNEVLMKPLFEIYIPRLKVGMFLKELPLALQEHAADISSGKASKAQIARDTWTFVEDRLGEMNFDNIFWNRTFKTAMQLLFRSVTWKLGNIRAMGGVTPEIAKELYQAYQEKRAPKMGQKLGWLLGLTALTAAVGTIIQMLYTGKEPESVKDLVYPRISETDRVATPTYIKDAYHFKHDPVGYFTSSTSGIWGKMIENWRNRDFYGQEIYGLSDNAFEKYAKETLHVIPKPISVSSIISQKEQGIPANRQAISFFGVNKAPAYINYSPAEKMAMTIKDRHPTGTRTEDQVERSKLVSKFMNELRGKIRPREDVINDIQQARRDFKLSETQKKYILKNADTPRIVAMSRYFSVSEMAEIIKVSDNNEKNLLLPIFKKKITNSDIPSTEKEKYRQFSYR